MCTMIIILSVTTLGVFKMAQKSQNVLFSIKPQYSSKILDGQKTVELRRRFPQEKTRGVRAVIYSSSPVQAITGHFRISDVEKLCIKDLWERFGKAACIDKKDFFSYFHNTEFGYAIHVEDPQKFDVEVTISTLREKFNFTPPQSFRYLADELGKFLDEDRLQISY